MESGSPEKLERTVFPAISALCLFSAVSAFNSPRPLARSAQVFAVSVDGLLNTSLQLPSLYALHSPVMAEKFRHAFLQEPPSGVTSAFRSTSNGELSSLVQVHCPLL